MSDHKVRAVTDHSGRTTGGFDLHSLQVAETGTRIDVWDMKCKSDLRFRTYPVRLGDILNTHFSILANMAFRDGYNLRKKVKLYSGPGIKKMLIGKRMYLINAGRIYYKKRKKQ